MAKFEVTVEFRTPLRASSSFSRDNVKIEPADYGFLLKKTVESEERWISGSPPHWILQTSNEAFSAGYKVKEWAETLADTLALIKGVPVQAVLRGATQVSEPVWKGEIGTVSAMSHMESKAEPVQEPLTEGVFTSASDLVQKITADPSKELFSRAMSWYSRGLRETDLVDKFIDHWIALETLSNTYTGPTEPKKCPYCNEVVDPKPDRAIVRGFLKSLGLQGNQKIAMKCNDIRGRLLHEAKATSEATALQPLLTNLLKTCLDAYLQMPESSKLRRHSSSSRSRLDLIDKGPKS